MYSDTHAVVREFFNHYSRSYESDHHYRRQEASGGVDGSSSHESRPHQLEISSAQRRVSRVGFQDFTRDIGLFQGSLRGEAGEGTTTTTTTTSRSVGDQVGSTTVLQRDHVDDVFVRTLEQQRRELQSSSSNIRNTTSFEHSERLNTGLDYRSFHEATTELFAMLSHGDRFHSDETTNSEMGEDIVRRLNETLGMYRARLIETDALRKEGLMSNHGSSHVSSALLTTPSSSSMGMGGGGGRREGGKDATRLGMKGSSTTKGSLHSPSRTYQQPSMVEIAKVKRKLRAAGMFSSFFISLFFCFFCFFPRCHCSCFFALVKNKNHCVFTVCSLCAFIYSSFTLFLLSSFFFLLSSVFFSSLHVWWFECTATF